MGTYASQYDITKVLSDEDVTRLEASMPVPMRGKLYERIQAIESGVRVLEYDVEYPRWSAAALTKTIDLGIPSMHNHFLLRDAFYSVVVEPVGPSISAWELEVGAGSDVDKLLLSEDLIGIGLGLAGTDGDQKGAAFQVITAEGPPTTILTPETKIVAKATATGANLSVMTGGRIKFYVLGHLLPF